MEDENRPPQLNSNERYHSMEWYRDHIEERFHDYMGRAERNIVKNRVKPLPPIANRASLYQYYLKDIPYSYDCVFQEIYCRSVYAQYEYVGAKDANKQEQFYILRVGYLKILNLIDAFLNRLCDYNIDRSVFRFGFNPRRAREAMTWLICGQVDPEIIDAQDVNRLRNYFSVQIERRLRIEGMQENGAYYDKSDVDKEFRDVMRSLEISASEDQGRSAWRKAMREALADFKMTMRTLINEIFDNYDYLSVYRDYLVEMEFQVTDEDIIALGHAVTLADTIKEIILQCFSAYVKLPKFNLAKSDLSGVHFSRTILVNANFINSDFRNANLENANASDSDFSICNLSLVNAEGATLNNCEFSYSNLSGVIFDNATIKNSQFSAILLRDQLLDHSIAFADDLFTILRLRGDGMADIAMNGYKERSEQINEMNREQKRRGEIEKQVAEKSSERPKRYPDGFKWDGRGYLDKWKVLSLEDGENALDLALQGITRIDDFKGRLTRDSVKYETYFLNTEENDEEKKITRSLWDKTVAPADDFFPGLLIREEQKDEYDVPILVTVEENGRKKTVFDGLIEATNALLDKVYKDCKERVVAPRLLRLLKQAEKLEKTEERGQRFAKYGQISFQPASMKGVTVSKCALPELDISHTNVQNAAFEESDLSGCIGYYINAEMASFAASNLNNGEFFGANFKRTNFSKANCLGVAFIDCDLQGADFSRTRAVNLKVINTGKSERRGETHESPFLERLIRTDEIEESNVLSEITETFDDNEFLDEQNILADSMWNDAVLSNSFFMGMVMDRSQYNRVDFRNFVILNCVSRWSAFEKSDMSFALLLACSFHQSSLEDITLSKSHLFSCDFSGCRMKEAVIIGARADKAVFFDVDLSGANLSRSYFSNCIFRDCNFSRLNLASTYFVHCAFENVSFGNCIGLANALFEDCYFGEIGVAQSPSKRLLSLNDKNSGVPQVQVMQRPYRGNIPFYSSPILASKGGKA